MMAHSSIVSINAKSEQAFGEIACALLNSEGGFISVSPEMDVSAAFASVSPIAPKFELVQEGPNGLKIVEVPKGLDKPYSYKGRFMILRDGVAVPAERETIKEMLLVSVGKPLRWERQFADIEDIDNFDQGEMKGFVSALGNPSSCDLHKEFERIALMRRGRFTNAADVLLSRDVAKRQPQVRAVAVCFADKTDDAYRDYKRFEGHLLGIFDSLWMFVLQHTVRFMGFSEDDPQRVARYRFPKSAVREGLINALVHRDYSIYSGTLRLEISNQELSITSTGGLPDGLTEAEMAQGRISVLRNPDIANYLSIRKYMEGVGRGIVKIKKACEEYGLPPPIWECGENSVKLILKALPGGDYLPLATNPGNVYVNDTMPFKIVEIRNSDDGWGQRVQWWPEQWPEQWPETNANKILSLLYFRAMSKKEIALKLNIQIDSNSLKSALKDLMDRDFIEMTLKDKPTSVFQKYRITAKGATHLLEKK